MARPLRFAWLLPVLGALLAPFTPALAAPVASPETDITIARAAGPITPDGDLNDPGWRGVPPIVRWYETNPGDNIEPAVKDTAYLAYDDHYFYAAFRCQDPHPGAIRAPIGDHDAVPSSTDYAGVIVDSRNDGKSAQMFLANPNGVQYDAITNDATGEDNSPDFFWDSAGRITSTGYTLEIRIPFSSLRYATSQAPVWRILLYRNYPRDRRYQFFSEKLPRDVNCFVCNADRLMGLAQLPHGSHLVVAPFVTAQRASVPSNGLGTPLHAQDPESEAGLDVKWSPSSTVAIDATLNPDFSQVESDAAQIVANERFALFYPEKRPFFLEGVDLLSTSLNVMYTRTITTPSSGLRATGKLGSTAYTALVARDDGGGVVILPGPQGSDFALQDFRSDAGIVRFRHDIGESFVSALGTARIVEDGGYNAVAGPDFQWRPHQSDAVTGQLLYSRSETPERPDLAEEWDGRTLEDHAAQLQWSHQTSTFDWFLAGQDIGDEFRADNGFIPQVGYREAYVQAGYTIRPTDTFFSRVRFWTIDYQDAERDGTPLDQVVSVGAGMDGRWNSFIRAELNRDQFQVGDEWLTRFRPRLLVQASPSRVLTQISVDSYFGEEIDFTGARNGLGATITGSATLRPSAHLELAANASVRWLDLDEPDVSGWLFTAQVERLRATYSFNARSFVRLIGQYVRTDRDPTLYPDPSNTPARSAAFTSSALFAYKLNWQTVFYAGYGDERNYLTDTDRLEKGGNQVFAKLSYALQR